MKGIAALFLLGAVWAVCLLFVGAMAKVMWQLFMLGWNLL